MTNPAVVMIWFRTAFLIIPIAYANKRFAMFLKQFLRPLLPGREVVVYQIRENQGNDFFVPSITS
jgi:uncharacterized membrane protein YidH (DUF202 family)